MINNLYLGSMFRNIFLFIFLILSANVLISQMTATELLDKSIAFHDPKNQWEKFDGTLKFIVERPDKPNGKRKVHINNKEDSFSFWAQYEDGLLNYTVKNNQGSASWNGSKEISEELTKKYRISPDRAIMYRDYYTYLYGMPMKLKDEGTIIDPELTQLEFYGKTYNRIRVSYTPEVGKDIWYFYFNSENHALEAYQFFHDETKNDGEYMLFSELKEIQKVKMPRIRAWYYNKDEKYLATDILEN